MARTIISDKKLIYCPSPSAYKTLTLIEDGKNVYGLYIIKAMQNYFILIYLQYNTVNWMKRYIGYFGKCESLHDPKVFEFLISGPDCI